LREVKDDALITPTIPSFVIIGVVLSLVLK
jgi:hypothetical protein